MCASILPGGLAGCGSMTSVTARLFGSGSPSTGEPAELIVSSDHLEVRTPYVSHRVEIASLRMREIGIDQSGLELAWDTAEGVRAVHVTDVDAVRMMRSESALRSTPQMLALRSSQQRQKAGRTIGWTALGAVILLPIVLLVVFLWQADRIALAVAERIPVTQEVQLGEHAFNSMRGTLKLQESGAAHEAVQTLGARLTKRSRYTYRFHVAKHDAINAFALPGGIIVVHTGLIEATRRPEELAGVLAHEIQHVEQRHSLQAAIKNLGLRALWLLVAGDAYGSLLGQAAVELTTLTFSRSAESQADARAFDALVANGIDPGGMADFFSVLSEQEGNTPAFLSTHPAGTEREKILRNRQTELGQRQFAALQLDPWPPGKAVRADP
jgi:beta-barrel assembly-enhancing protease